MAKAAVTPAEEQPGDLNVRGLTKSFGALKALDGATLSVRQGEIHGLVGQNGAGKSTLIKILAGLLTADAGDIRLGDRDLTGARPREIETAGIHFIHQERLLVPDFTVAEALFLGREMKVGPFLARRQMNEAARALMHRYFDNDIAGSRRIEDLRAGEQQIVQIVRALLDEPRILVLDEPTAALVRSEIDHLFAALERLRDAGMTVIYISHYLSEIEAICDRVSVLRNGRTVATVDPRRVSSREIASLMVARDIADMYPPRQRQAGPPVLAVNALGDGASFADVSFELHAGEVLGLTGLQGSGAKELLKCLFGLARPAAGDILIEDRPFKARSPREAAAQGVAFVPEDRRHQGVVLKMSIAANTTLADLKGFSFAGFLRSGREDHAATRMIGDLAIKAQNPNVPVEALSGGNQQKVVLAKWLTKSGKIYVLDEPTLGIDVAAKVEIYEIIEKLAREGAAILIVSNDLDELLGVTDRVLVMYRGAISARLDSTQTTPASLLDLILTGKGEGARGVH